MIKKLLLVLLILTTYRTNAQGFLDINGTVTHRDSQNRFKGAKIEVMGKEHSSLVATTTNDTGGYEFQIPLFPPVAYTVVVSDSGFVTKTFIVSTEGIPSEELQDKFPKVIPDLDLFKRLPGMDYSSIAQPLNRYYYDKEKDNIIYDRALIEVTLKNLAAIKLKEDYFLKKDLLIKAQQQLAQKKRTLILSGLIFIIVLAVIITLIVILIRRRNRKLQNEAWRESNNFKK